MYNPNFEIDFFRNIPQKLRPVYLKYLVLNIGLLVDSLENMSNEQIEKFLCFLVSRESIEIVKKEGAIILFNDPTIKGE